MASSTPVLKKGSKGEAVSRLQEGLQALGYHVGPIDGDFRGRPRARLGERQLWAPCRLGRAVCVLGAVVIVRGCGGEREARAQALKGGVRLDVEAVDREVGAVDQVVLAAEADRAREQPLEEPGVDEATGVGVGDRLVDRQAVCEAVAEKAAQIETHGRHPQKLAGRADPLERAAERELDEHDRVERGPALLGVVGGGGLAHERPVDELVEAAVAVVGGHQLVEADDLDLKCRRVTLRRPHCHTETSPRAYRMQRMVPSAADGKVRSARGLWTGP